MKYISTIIFFSGLLTFIFFGEGEIHSKNKIDSINESSIVNTVIDQYKGVKIYLNGSISKNHGRNLTKDGYNLGLKWQCVEFVKRFYFLNYEHKMPDTYGHAKDFFDKNVKSGWNSRRAMTQYVNGSKKSPKVDMILVFDRNNLNPFGHIAIISEVKRESITIAQQNWGTQTRMQLPIKVNNNQYFIDHPDVLGWLSL
tara:strand:+ start:627 stop:1220 length:594 start_codon:yes stop_codon:yes gene_type:complete